MLATRETSDRARGARHRAIEALSVLAIALALAAPVRADGHRGAEGGAGEQRGAPSGEDGEAEARAAGEDGELDVPDEEDDEPVRDARPEGRAQRTGARPARGSRSPRARQREREAPAPEPEGFTYVVRSGDTLSDIAVRFGVSLDALTSTNPGLDVDRIRAGQSLRIVNGLRRVVHTVERGESLSRIAERYEVTIDAILRANAGLHRDRVPAGRQLVVLTRVPESRSMSIGAPADGELAFARQLPTRHPAFYVRTPSRAYGTDETVRFIVEGLEAVRAADPDAPRVEIHDLSFEEGGPINGHHSHESGRDADIGYYQRDCDGMCRIRRIRPEQLDVARQWALFSHWIERGVVETIFMDHELAAALYDYARTHGVSRRELSRLFQYPRSVDDRYGLIRHHPRHADHFHVRFVCPETDPDCR